MPPSSDHIAKPVFDADHGSLTESTARLIVEEPLEIRVNGVPFAVLMRTPGYERELALGFCLTEGIVDSLSEIEGLGFCPDATDNMENIVNVIVASAAENRLAQPPDCTGEIGLTSHRSLVSRSSCGICGVRMIEDLSRQLSPIPSGPEFPLSRLVELQYSMSDGQELSRLTTGAHAVILAKSDGKLIVVREDVGRHNALDKVIGFALLNNVDCRDCVALLSGRISFEMVQKAVRARIPLLAGISAPTSMAVNLAEQLNCTLVGRLRDQRMVIYAHPERLSAQS